MNLGEHYLITYPTREAAIRVYHMFCSQPGIYRQRAILSNQIKTLENITLDKLLVSLVVLPAIPGGMPRENAIALRNRKIRVR